MWEVIFIKQVVIYPGVDGGEKPGTKCVASLRVKGIVWKKIFLMKLKNISMTRYQEEYLK